MPFVIRAFICREEACRVHERRSAYQVAGKSGAWSAMRGKKTMEEGDGTDQD